MRGDDPDTLIEKYALIGGAAGSASSIFTALVFHGPLVISAFIGTVAALATGAGYGYWRLRRAALH